jgi:hypothetical protein
VALRSQTLSCDAYTHSATHMLHTHNATHFPFPVCFVCGESVCVCVILLKKKKKKVSEMKEVAEKYIQRVQQITNVPRYSYGLGLLRDDGGPNRLTDNFFSSPRLFDDLLRRKIHTCGTVWPNRKDMPSDFGPTKLKLTRGDVRVRTIGNLTALAWKDRR